MQYRFVQRGHPLMSTCINTTHESRSRQPRLKPNTTQGDVIAAPAGLIVLRLVAYVSALNVTRVAGFQKAAVDHTMFESGAWGLYCGNSATQKLHAQRMMYEHTADRLCGHSMPLG